MPARSLFPPEIIVGEPYRSAKYLLHEHWLAVRGGAVALARPAPERLHELLQPLDLHLLQVGASAAAPTEELYVLRIGGPLTIDTPSQLDEELKASGSLLEDIAPVYFQESRGRESAATVLFHVLLVHPRGAQLLAENES